MLHERTADYDQSRSNLAFLKATKKMVEILKSQGQNPKIFLSKEQIEALEEDKIKSDFI